MKNLSKILGLAIITMMFFGTWTQSKAQKSMDMSHGSHHESATSEKESDIPNTINGIFSAVSAKQAEIQGYIEKNKLDNIHEPAFEIAKLANGLKKKVNKLSQEDLKKRDASLKNIDALAKSLDEYGDAGNATQTKATFKKLDEEVKTLKGLYGIKSIPSSTAKLYTCTMHPEVISDKPGNCPKCDMKLVVKSQ